MTTINVQVFDNAESWLKANLPDLTSDSVCSISRGNPITDKVNGYLDYRYTDHETNESKYITMADHVKGLQLLCEQIGNTLFVGGLKSPKQLIDPCNWDAEVVDAYRQLCFYGEVIYG